LYQVGEAKQWKINHFLKNIPVGKWIAPNESIAVQQYDGGSASRIIAMKLFANGGFSIRAPEFILKMECTTFSGR